MGIKKDFLADLHSYIEDTTKDWSPNANPNAIFIVAASHDGRSGYSIIGDPIMLRAALIQCMENDVAVYKEIREVVRIIEERFYEQNAPIIKLIAMSRPKGLPA